MNDFSHADFYTDRDLHADPHAYFDWLRAQGPVARLPQRNVIAITGYEEAIAVMLDNEHFSAINAVTGPVPELPIEVTGDDITEQVQKVRPQLAFADQIVTQDGARHADLRSVMSRLFTPSASAWKLVRMRWCIAGNAIARMSSGSASSRPSRAALALAPRMSA